MENTKVPSFPLRVKWQSSLSHSLFFEHNLDLNSALQSVSQSFLGTQTSFSSAFNVSQTAESGKVYLSTSSISATLKNLKQFRKYLKYINTGGPVWL